MFTVLHKPEVQNQKSVVSKESIWARIIRHSHDPSKCPQTKNDTINAFRQTLTGIAVIVEKLESLENQDTSIPVENVSP